MPETAEEIAYCHACGSPMNVADVGPFSNVECPHCGKHTRVKREFGAYTLLRRHAVGGMSVVFVAHDNTLDREVAVKILNENYSADSRRIEAFEHEARVTASFSHPHVVRVFTTGRAFDRYYIAMELVSGGHFEDRIQERGTVPEREMLPFAIQVAEGLKAAHAAGLIHRDIKPGNILLDGSGNAKIVDFGLALLLETSGTAKASEIWATPYYVPPETIEGQPEDFRSDMYAFGATLYHALAGKPPCNEESMATNILREAKRKVVPLQQAAPWVTPRTCAVVDRAMAYEPNNRFNSYDELLSYLQDAYAQVKAGAKPIVKDPIAAKRRAAAKQRERILIGAGLAAVAMALVGAIWWVTRPNPEKPGDKPVAVPDSGHTQPGQDPATAARIAKLYRQARDAVSAGDYSIARAHFASLREDSAVGEPTRTWSAMEAVLMPLLDGQSAAARVEAAATARHLSTATLPDPSVKSLLLPVLEEFSKPAAPTVGNEPPKGNSPQRLVFWMLAGLKHWENGRLTQAEPFFKAVTEAKTAPQDEWLQTYQTLAAAYLADFSLLTGPVFDASPTDGESCEKAIQNLNAMIPQLKTRGRAKFNAEAWKRDLAKLAKRQPVATPITPDAPARPVLRAVLDTLARHAAKCDFLAASEYLKTLPADPDGASRKSLMALTDSATLFLNDLNTDLKRAPEGFAVSGKLRNGDAFTKVSASDQPSKIRVSLNGPSRDCAWADLEPESVVDIYRTVIKPETDADRKLRRHETAIAFQWLSGMREQATAAAERLAAESESFKDRWESIKSGLPGK
ncbi:MAG: serine/threonine protein kinase [Verrucomicrobia bacterium]|nr:serine/threonine protein kinase [Verrucomicrobiota bacterium]